KCEPAHTSKILSKLRRDLLLLRVTGGKTRKEYMCSELSQIADIVATSATPRPPDTCPSCSTAVVIRRRRRRDRRRPRARRCGCGFARALCRRSASASGWRHARYRSRVSRGEYCRLAVEKRLTPIIAWLAELRVKVATDGSDI